MSDSTGNVISTKIVMDVKEALQGIKQLEDALNRVKQNKTGKSTISSNLGEDINSAERIASNGVLNINSKLSNIGNVKTSTKFADSYSKSINDLTLQAERYHRQFQTSGNTEALDKFNRLIPVIRQLNSEQQNFNRILGVSGDTLGKLGSTLKSHLSYMATGVLIGGIVGIPLAMSNIAKETEVITQKIRQNLELADQYHGKNQVLEQDLKRLSDIAGVFSVGYGVDLDKTMQTMQLLSRRFKDVESIAYLTSVAITMNKLDFVDLEKAAMSLEAVVLQFGLSTRETRDFLNDFSVAVHIANIKGTDLLDALQRSGSSFKQFNMGTREAIAAISALSTETARTGSTIGNTFKSIAANFNMKKAIEALDAYGIKLYDVNEQGLKTMRKGANVFQELQGLFGQLDDEGRGKLALAISGGKLQVNAMMSFLGDANQNFTKILGEIQTKSSDEMTAAQLKLGLETYQIKLMQLQASMQVFSKTIGDDVLPSLKNMVDGLTNGVIWLTENHDAVSKTMSALVELAKVVAAFYIQQSISNKLVAEGTILLRSMYLLEGNFSAAFSGMRTALATFAATAAATCIQLAVLYTAINVVSAAYDRMSDKSGLVGQEQDTSNQLAAVEGNRKTALGMKARTGMSEDEINAIYDGQANDLRAKLTNIQEQRKTAGNAATNKAQEESENNFKAIIDKAMAAATVRTPEIGNMIPEKQGHTSAGSRYAPDNSEQAFRRDAGREMDHEMKTAKVSSEEYASSLELLAAKEHIFGNSTEINATKLELMNKRVLTLIGQSMQYEDMANSYETQAQDRVMSNAKLVESLDAAKVSWSSLTKEEKQAFIQRNREYIQDEITLNKLLELADKARVASAEARREGNKTAIAATEMSVDQLKKDYEKSMRILDYDKQHDISKLGYNATSEQKDVIELAYAVKELMDATVELQRVKALNGEASEEYKKQQAEVDKLKLKVDQLNGTKLDKIKVQFSDMIVAWAVEGRSFNDIWSGIWKEFEADAIKSLFNIKHEASFLGSILNGSGGSGGILGWIGNLFGGGTVKKAHSGENITSNAPKMHDGGLVSTAFPLKDDEVLRTLQVGERVLSKDANKAFMGIAGNLKNYSNGTSLTANMPKVGTEVVANISKATIEKASAMSANASNAAIAQISREHIVELQEANGLMRQQNSMLMTMMQQGGNGGQTQPIIVPVGNQMTPDDLMGMVTKMRRNGYQI